MWNLLKFIIVIALIILVIAFLLVLGVFAVIGNVVAQILSLPLSCIVALIVLLVSTVYIIFGD